MLVSFSECGNSGYGKGGQHPGWSGDLNTAQETNDMVTGSSSHETQVKSEGRDQTNYYRNDGFMCEEKQPESMILEYVGKNKGQPTNNSMSGPFESNHDFRGDVSSRGSVLSDKIAKDQRKSIVEKKGGVLLILS